MRKLRNFIRQPFNLALALILTSGTIFGTSGSQSRTGTTAAGGWDAINTGLTNLDVRALAIARTNAGGLYAGTTIYAATSAGLFKSTDSGSSWSNTTLSGYPTVALAINPTDPNILYAGTFPGGWCASTFPLFNSTDGGATWSNQTSPAECDISLIVMDPTNPNTLYVGSEANYIGADNTFLAKSTDGGETWAGGGHRIGVTQDSTKIGDGSLAKSSDTASYIGGLASYGLVIDPINSQTLYMPGDIYESVNLVSRGLVKSTDGGSSWSLTGITTSSSDVTINITAIDPHNPSILYAGTRDLYPVAFRGLIKSTDGGDTWSYINNGIGNLIGTNASITALVVHPDKPHVLYAGTSGGGVFKSTDGGANWKDFSKGLPNLDVRALALAPGNPNTLYVGTSGGVFKITDDSTVLRKW